MSTGDSSRQSRLEYIIQTVGSGRFVSLRELSDRFDINIQTARRDIAHLAEQQLLVKVHGGANPLAESDTTSIEERLAVHNTEKRCIAEAAVSLVENGDVIYIDGGSTTSYMAPLLTGMQITVVTNSVSILSALRNNWPEIEVVITGGHYYPKSELLLGLPAIQALQDMQVNKAFLSAAGITSEGIYNANAMVVELEQTVIARASKTYLLADSSKFDRISLMRICELDKIDTIITCGSIPETIITAADKAHCGIKLVEC